MRGSWKVSVVFIVVLVFSCSGRLNLDSVSLIDGSSVAAWVPELSLNQTAELKIAFLGVSQDYVDTAQLTASVPHSLTQFAYPNTMTWTLNLSCSFSAFPNEVSASLQNNAFRSDGSEYFNI